MHNVVFMRDMKKRPRPIDWGYMRVYLLITSLSVACAYVSGYIYAILEVLHG